MCGAALALLPAECHCFTYFSSNVNIVVRNMGYYIITAGNEQALLDTHEDSPFRFMLHINNTSPDCEAFFLPFFA